MVRPWLSATAIAFAVMVALFGVFAVVAGEGVAWVLVQAAESAVVILVVVVGARLAGLGSALDRWLERRRRADQERGWRVSRPRSR